MTADEIMTHDSYIARKGLCKLANHQLAGRAPLDGCATCNVWFFAEIPEVARLYREFPKTHSRRTV